MFNKAVEFYQKVLVLEPKNLYAASGLAALLAIHKNYNESLNYYETVYVYLYLD